MSSINLGLFSYNQAECTSILRESVSGNGLVSLAHQLIAAKLNVARGANPLSVQATILAADALIATIPLRIPPVEIPGGQLAPSLVSALVNVLTQFNEGDLGAPHCDDDPGGT